MPTISNHGSAGSAARPSALTRAAASPTIVSRQTIASVRMESRSTSARPRPRASSAARRAATSICCSRARSGAFIDDPGGSQDTRADVRAEILRRAEVDGPTDDLRQLVLESHHVEQAHARGGREIDEEVQVAGGPEFVAERGPEDRQSADAVALAEGCYPPAVEGRRGGARGRCSRRGRALGG